MSLILRRFFTVLTLLTYLIVGSVAVRFCVPESVSLKFSSSYLNLVTDAPLTATSVSVIEEPSIAFAEIVIPVEKVIVKAPVRVASVKVPTVPQTVVVKPAAMEWRKTERNELPFQETVKLSKIVIQQELPTQLASLYHDLSIQDSVVDEVSTKIAATAKISADAEPEFFEYPTEEAVPAQKEKTAEKVPTEVKKENTVVHNVPTEVVASTPEVKSQNLADLVEVPTTQEVTEALPVVEYSGTESEVTESAPAEAPVVAQTTTIEPEFFDYAAEVATQPEVKTETAKVESKVESAPVASVNTVVAFDYSKANAAVANQIIPTVSNVTIQKPTPAQTETSNPSIARTNEEIEIPDSKGTPDAINGFLPGYPVSLNVVAMGSDLKKIEILKGFEIRFQDDMNEILEDYGTGEVSVNANLSQPKMTRTMTVLKRGFIPTTTELILDKETLSVSIPTLETETFNNLQAPYESKGTVGAVLIELDDASELAKLDVPFGKVVKLDGEFKKTNKDDFRYQLFLGVRAGNAMISYHRGANEVLHKIVHVHENEVTYDSNFYEDVVNEKISLYEEDLLGKETSPLVISSEHVKIFASSTASKKVNNHTYKMNFGDSHLGGRRYIELSHQSEPVFVGIRDNNTVTVPSENFMRFILSKLEGAKLANRCMIQINLTKKAERFDVAAESVADSLSVTTQVLDNDGKFYDSISEKTQKIVVIGESDGSEHISPDAKVNLKIQYQDGTVQFLNSYCSPNTYLVEQL